MPRIGAGRVAPQRIRINRFALFLDMRKIATWVTPLFASVAIRYGAP
jgi:hypothetical protein